MAKQILIVEDDIDLAKILKTILEQNGYRTRVALDGAEALDAVLKDVIDLVVTDLKMSWVEGDIVTRLLKGYEKTRHIPILVYTGLSPEEIGRYQLEGVEAIVRKPVEPKVLLEKIKEIFLRAS
ncbi:MAG: hypothetical protein A3C53_04350 [Omnitrophica WOR_2 bacterium RIFCSPHIGHO2_02_FULL_68_15]|nr:MAG: hypothetical protein A3C53_04350 [Omnitrophica WOR_2 bacterium RIFCSPHIGHO2_02_FULL_68_15]